MKKEIVYRIGRILFTLSFMLLSTLLWSNSYVSNVEALEFENSLNKNISLIELSDGINLKNALPISDEEGAKCEGYKFKVVNNSNDETTYKATIINNISNDESLMYSVIRYQVIKNGKIFIEANTLNDNGILFEDKVGKENTYEIKFWISYDSGSEIFNKIFSIKIAII